MMEDWDKKRIRDFPRIPIPSERVDYREVAETMRYNIDLLKKELSDHVDKELKRFFDTMQDSEF